LAKYCTFSVSTGRHCACVNKFTTTALLSIVFPQMPVNFSAYIT